jgi:probable HAF family extracellular repeat protein
VHRIHEKEKVMHFYWLIGVLVALAPPVAPSSAGHGPVQMVELGTLGGHFSRANAINDRGEVVGASATGEGNTHAFLWRDGRMVDLGTLGGRHSIATAINNRGEVVGTSSTADGDSHAFLWRDGRMTDLGTLGGASDFTMATDINERGDIVGDNDGPVGLQAFLWRDGQMTALDAGPSRAAGINERGEVVATNYTNDGSSTVIWRDGRTSRLHEGYGIDINDRGQVVIAQGYLWHRGLLTRIGPPAGSSSVEVRAINNRGLVVGSSELGAFVWQGGQTTLLPRAAGDHVTVAEDINGRGQITGSSGVDESVMRAVLWTR